MSTRNLTKTCTKCNELKSIDEFYKDKRNKDGYRYTCKQCDKEYKKTYYKDNIENYRHAYNEFIKRNPTYRKDYYQMNKL